MYAFKPGDRVEIVYRKNGCVMHVGEVIEVVPAGHPPFTKLGRRYGSTPAARTHESYIVAWKRPGHGTVKAWPLVSRLRLAQPATSPEATA